MLCCFKLTHLYVASANEQDIPFSAVEQQNVLNRAKRQGRATAEKQTIMARLL
jgi:hypothetical protein